MKLRLHCVPPCLLLLAVFLQAQEPAANPTPPPATPIPTPAQQSSGTLRAPVEVASPVNNGHGLSLDVIYWFDRSRPVLRGGQADRNLDPGNFNYTTNPDRALGYRLSVPVGNNAVVRTSYFQTQSTGFSVIPTNSVFFGQGATGGDIAATRYKFEGVKASYEYLTYFWKHSNSEVRLKTLWEVQRLSITNEIDDFALNNDGVTFSLNTATGARSILLPTFGLGIEYTMSPHFRVEARGSGFGLPHKSDIADAEGTVAYRRGHVEAIGGYRLLHFKSNPKLDFYNAGTLSGPYVGLRLYWKKQ